MDIINIIIDRLKNENINAVYAESAITWHDDRGKEHSINEIDIAYSNGKLAWFQSDHWNDDLLCLLYGDEYFNWIPVSENEIEYCHLIEWYQDYLIFVFEEEQGVSICVVKDKAVTHFYYHGIEIGRKNDIIFFREYRSQSLNVIKRLKLPELKLLEPVTAEEALKDGVTIAIIGYPNDLSYEK